MYTFWNLNLERILSNQCVIIATQCVGEELFHHKCKLNTYSIQKFLSLSLGQIRSRHLQRNLQAYSNAIIYAHAKLDLLNSYGWTRRVITSSILA